MRQALLAAAVLAALAAPSFAQEPTITVKTGETRHPVSPTLYGLFFEEINRAGDGGIYAELVQNRSFEDDGRLPSAWKIEGGLASITASRNPYGFNRNALLLEPASGGTLKLSNDGFKGMHVKEGAAYKLTFDAAGRGAVKVTLEKPDGTVLASAVPTEDEMPKMKWSKANATLRPSATESNARLVVHVTGEPVTVDMVSLFPTETWKDRGLRPDLMQLLDDTRTSFTRFPGGCWVEGNTMLDAYNWKATVGPVAERRTQHNLWNYKSTNGLGYHEYLQMCEDLGHEALFVVNCGMSHREVVPMNRLGSYVQDALDAVEYAIGDASTPWGALRAANGHPEPFKLTMVQIGNENGGPEYNERYAVFYDALKAKYPDLKLIANLWQGRPDSRPIEILDEHYYMTPEWFAEHADQYDAYDRSGPKIYVGEYAVTRGEVGGGNLKAAVGEAAFMTGMERNADVVVMSSYAPLFAHVGYKAWNPDAINFDASRAYGTPSYHVQKMFATSRPDVTVPVEVSNNTTEKTYAGNVGVGTWRTQAEFKDVVVTGADGKTLYDSNAASGEFAGMERRRGDWAVVDGQTLKQTGDLEGAWLVAENVPADLGAYTLTLKARKTGGDEGFLVRFHGADRDSFSYWNVGGWDNSQSAIERNEGRGSKSTLSPLKPSRVETGRWYDLKLVVTPTGVQGFVDGKLDTEFKYPQPKLLYASAGKKGGETVVKIVNFGDQPRKATLKLDGARAATAKTSTLTHRDPLAENTLDEPTRVAPVDGELALRAGAATHEFPAYSVTVLRVPAN